MAATARDLEPLPPKVQVATYVPQDLADELASVAWSRRITRSELLRRLCEDFVAGCSTRTGAPT